MAGKRRHVTRKRTIGGRRRLHRGSGYIRDTALPRLRRLWSRIY